VAQTIKEVMTPDPITLQNSASVEEAAKLMKADDIGDVLVVNRNKKLTGILTDRDIVLRVVAEGADPKTVKVEEVATKDVKSVAPETVVEDAVVLMRREAIRRIPVVEEGKLVGVVTLGDLAVERDPTSALADISAAPPDHAEAASVSTNGRRAAGELGKALPAVAFGASLAFAMNKVRGRSRRKTVAIAAKKLRRAGKKLRKSGDKVGAEAASRAADYVAKASKEIRKGGKKLGEESSKQLESKIEEIKRIKLNDKLSDLKGKKLDDKISGMKRKLEEVRGR
jgi:CBS domain-containing protein